LDIFESQRRSAYEVVSIELMSGIGQMYL